MLRESATLRHMNKSRAAARSLHREARSATMDAMRRAQLHSRDASNDKRHRDRAQAASLRVRSSAHAGAPVITIPPCSWRTLVQKTASAKWSGGIKDGKGFIST